MNYQDRKGLGGGRAVTLISMNDWFRMSVWTTVLPFTIRRLKDILTKITVFCHEAARLSHFSLSCHRHLSKKKPLPDWYWLLAYTSASHISRRRWKFWRNQVGGLLDVQGSTGGQNELLLLFQFADHYSLPPIWCKTAAPSKWGRYFGDCILESGLCVLYLVFGYVSLHGWR